MRMPLRQGLNVTALATSRDADATVGLGVTIFPGNVSGRLNYVARASSPWCRYSDTSLLPGKMVTPVRGKYRAVS
jgi:hypothetical protein